MNKNNKIDKYIGKYMKFCSIEIIIVRVGYCEIFLVGHERGRELGYSEEREIANLLLGLMDTDVDRFLIEKKKIIRSSSMFLYTSNDYNQSKSLVKYLK